jgi:threonine dehydratase
MRFARNGVKGAVPVQLAHVRAAAMRLAQSAQVPNTPVLKSAWVDATTRVNVHFKCEHLQVTGSFKYRGGINAVFSLDDEAAKRGIVAHSSGNHG